MKNKNVTEKNKVLVFGITLLSIIVITGVGFAFFSSPVTNTNNESVTAETATISLKFDDNDSGISGTLNLGESITKKFTLENTGTKDAYARINWVDLINTYTSQSLSYILEQSTSENGTYTKIASDTVPRSTSSETKELKNNILVPVNTKYYYKLTITLNNLDINQNDDINAEFHTKFNIEEGSSKKYATETIKDLVLDANASSIDEITAEYVSDSCTNTLAYDGTVDNNLRYTGANPCNYVSFNGEIWRIIGVMNNIDDGYNNKNARVKLVRKNNLGNYSWDTAIVGENGATSKYGINDWSQADLMKELNGDYLNTTLTENTYWYNGVSNKKEEIYNFTNGLKIEYQNLIESVKWNLGGLHGTNFTATGFYLVERETHVWGSTDGQECDDGACPRSTEWKGKVALIYPSDYGFAVGGSTRTECLNNTLFSYNSHNCLINDWIEIPETTRWLLTPRSNIATNVYGISTSGNLNNFYVSNNRAVYPSLYLKSNVIITDGNGSEENPFTLGL